MAKRGRLEARSPSHGSAEEGMKAFWQSVQANGNGSNSSSRGQVIGEEEEEDEEQREQNAEDESNEMRSSESQKATGLGKRFRRYTIAY